MNIKRSLIAAAVFMSMSAVTFAQQPANQAEKKAHKEARAASDTAKKAMHHHAKKVKEPKKG